MKTAVVIPCHNEAVGLTELIARVRLYTDYVIVANDSSTDRTTEIARDAGAKVVHVPADRRGLSDVYVFGLRAALALTDAGRICEMDAGGSHDPSELRQFLSSGMSVVAGCRFNLPGAQCLSPWPRRLLSFLGTKLVNLLHGTNFRDATSGYVSYTRPALEKLLSTPYESVGHYYQTEMRLRALSAGFMVHEVPITYRSSGSSLNWRSIWEALRQVL